MKNLSPAEQRECRGLLIMSSKLLKTRQGLLQATLCGAPSVEHPT